MSLTDEQEQQRIAAIEAEMAQQGVSTTLPVQADYFGFDETMRVNLPDGKSWVEHRLLNEGARRKYLNAVNRDVRVSRSTGDAIMRMSPGDEKKALLEAAITNWNLVRAGEPIPFTKHHLTEFLEKANPRIIDLIEFEIRKANAWLQSEMSVEDLEKEIERLSELRDQKVREAEGKVSS